MRVLSLLLACFAVVWAAPVFASTVQFDMTITFTATKTSHDCVDGLYLGDPDPGTGRCGSYQGVALGETVSAGLSFVGLFDETDSGWSLTNAGFEDISCWFGEAGCLVSTLADATIYEDVISVRPYGSFDSRFEFDLLNGTGLHAWVDDALPFFGKGTFALSDVHVSGMENLAVMPLPAGAWLMLTGGLAFRWVRRRQKGAADKR